jgi:antitoxin HigA-1
MHSNLNLLIAKQRVSTWSSIIEGNFMPDKHSLRDRKTAPTPPGKLLAEDILPATGRSKTEVAKLLGISRQSLHDILACKQPVTPQMAVRLGKLFGNGPRLWLGMQAAHDLWVAERSVNTRKIPTLEIA